MNAKMQSIQQTRINGSYNSNLKANGSTVSIQMDDVTRKLEIKKCLRKKMCSRKPCYMGYAMVILLIGLIAQILFMIYLVTN